MFIGYRILSEFLILLSKFFLTFVIISFIATCEDTQNKDQSIYNICFHSAKLLIFGEVSKEYFAVVDAEDAAVANLAALAGGKYFYIPPTSVKIVSQGDTISEFEYAPIRLPHV